MEADPNELMELSIMNNLPDEILSAIFFRLPLSDRKNAKLACKRWYHCSTRGYITKNERYVFRGDYAIKDMTLLTRRSMLTCMNVELHGIRLRRLPTNAWSNCGNQINALKFIDCVWSEKSLHDVIVHCVNLTSFAIVEKESYKILHPIGEHAFVLLPQTLLRELVNQGIQRTQLNSFTVHAYTFLRGTEDLMNLILRIYTRVRKFGIGTTLGADRVGHCDLLLEAKNESMCSSFMECIKTFIVRLENINRSPSHDGTWLKTLAESVRGLRLKNFTSSFGSPYASKRALFEFFDHQHDLRNVQLLLPYSNDKDDVKSIIFGILDRCPSVRIFQCVAAVAPIITPTEFPRFVTLISKLECLLLPFHGRGSLNTPMYEIVKHFPESFDLTSLTYQNRPPFDEDWSVRFLERFPLLEYLRIVHASDNILQTIFKNLLKLKYLFCSGYTHCSDFGFTGHAVDREQGYSVKRLTQLRHFRMKGDCLQLTDTLLVEFQLPRLESFEWLPIVCEVISEPALIRFMSNVPNLKYLRIRGHKCPAWRDAIITLCKGLKNLHRFHIGRLSLFDEKLTDIFSFDEELVKNIFNACPSLRYIQASRRRVFVFDRPTDTVQLLSPNLLVRFMEPFPDEPKRTRNRN